MKLLTKEQEEIYENAKIYYICKEQLKNKYAKNEKYCKVRYHYHYAGEYKRAVYSICNSKYNVPKEVLIVFHNGFNTQYWSQHGHYFFQQKFSVGGASWTLEPSEEAVNFKTKHTNKKFAV